ncbi:AIPR family protein [Tsuneonella sp. HG222]
MNPVVKAQAGQFKIDESLHHLKESEVFESYTIYSVLSSQLGNSVDPLRAHLKGDEFGLDGAAVIIQGNLATDTDEANALLEDVRNPEVEFVFFQSKTGTGYDYGDIGKLFDAVVEFFQDELVGESDQLDDLIDVKNLVYRKAVTRNNPGLRIYYATTGSYRKPTKIEKLIRDRTAKLQELSIFDNSRIVVEMLGADQLQAFYRSATRSTQVKIEFPRQVPLPKNPKVQQGFIGFLEAKELVKMVSVYDEDGQTIGINRFVFFDNVRDYNEGSSLNKKISGTIEKHEGHDFVFRNNGVTVIAKSILQTAEEFRVEDYQIVNGCQTTNILFENRDNLDDVYVPFRLIGSTDDTFISSIIVGTNSQNQIKEEQFLALLPFMKNLEEYAQSIDQHLQVFIERRENQYQREALERARIMPLAVLMKAVSATLLGQPNRSARDYKRIFKENSNIIFKENDDVRLYHAIAYLYYRLEFLWRNQRIDNALKIFRYYILWGVWQLAVGGATLVKNPKPRDVANAAKAVIDLASDEAKFKRAVKQIGRILEEQSKQLSQENRERLRDAIRSDTFFASVKAALVS